MYALSVVLVSEFIWRQLCLVWWLWCGGGIVRIRAAGWKEVAGDILQVYCSLHHCHQTVWGQLKNLVNLERKTLTMLQCFSFTAIRWCFSSFDSRYLWFFSFCIFQIFIYLAFMLDIGPKWDNWGPPMTGLKLCVIRFVASLVLSSLVRILNSIYRCRESERNLGIYNWN